jgi:hypothetical protein
VTEVARLKTEGDIVEGEKEGEIYCVLRGEGNMRVVVRGTVFGGR